MNVPHLTIQVIYIEVPKSSETIIFFKYLLCKNHSPVHSVEWHIARKIVWPAILRSIMVSKRRAKTPQVLSSVHLNANRLLFAFKWTEERTW